MQAVAVAEETMVVPVHQSVEVVLGKGGLIQELVAFPELMQLVEVEVEQELLVQEAAATVVPVS